MFTDATRVFVERLDRARAVMRTQGVDVLLLSTGADLPYFCGYEAMPLERFTVLVVPRCATATLVVPRLEASRVVERPTVFELRVWDETEDPIAITSGLLGSAEVVAVGDQMWARFLVDLMADIPDMSWRRASGTTGPIRSVKDAGEVEMLRAAGAAVDRVAADLQKGEITLVGQTEADVSAELGRRNLGGRPSPREFRHSSGGCSRGQPPP